MKAFFKLNTRFILDFRFWLVLFFIVRLVGIMNPPLEMAHNWRQTTVSMVARNFYEVDNNILYPRIDIAGEKSGITGMEFPLLNYLIYLVSCVFGYASWYGRLINLIVSSIGILFYYKILRRFFDEKLAFYSALVLIVSIWFVYSRKIMPDTFSVSLVIIGLYYGLMYLYDNKSFKYVLFYGIFICLGILSKVPAAILLSIMIFPYIMIHHLWKRKIIISLITILFLIPTIIWYFWWVPYLVETYGFWHFFMGGTMSVGFYEIISNLNLTFANFYSAAFGFSGFVVFLAGLIYSIVNKKWVLLGVLIVTLLPFMVIIIKSGNTFFRHSYYIIAFVPVMSVFIGYLLSSFRYRWLSIVVLLFVIIEMLANNTQDFRIKSKNRHILTLEHNLNNVSKKDDLIVINSGYTPTPMYFAHRKGWVYPNEFIGRKENLDSLKKLGCKHIVILKKSFGENIELLYNKVYDSEYYTIYSLK